MKQNNSFLSSLKKVRELFPYGKEGDQDIAELIKELLGTINAKTKGTIIGDRKTVDYEEIINSSVFPKKMQPVENVIDELVSLYEGTINRIHPLTQENVLPPPSKLSILAGSLVQKFNENSIWDYYGPGAAIAEVKTVAMMADLVGYDKTRAGGIFTFGGTGCNLYGARIGIEKSDPDAKYTGIRDKIIFFCSDTAHYSIISCAIWTGIGTNNLKVIRTDERNAMIVDDLKYAIKDELEKGNRIGTIFCTMGTTDSFGIDPLDKIVALRDNIEKELDYKIHIHADAVIGWPYLTFKDDRKTISQLSPRLAQEIIKICNEMTHIKYADSIGIDFHKTGWSPYLCSLFLVKNQSDFSLLKKSKKEMPYLYHGEGYQPGCFTLESSRPNYAVKALVNILSLGCEGYEAILIQILRCADYLRDIMEKTHDIVVLNKYNPAFVTDFRIYPVKILNKYGLNKHSLLSAEFNDNIPTDLTLEVNNYNRLIVETLMTMAYEKGTAILSYTDNYKSSMKGRAILAIKSYPMSPFIEKKHMEDLLKEITEVKKRLE